MIIGWILAVLAIAFGSLAVRDFLAREAGFVFVTLRRDQRPASFWVLIAIEAALGLLFALSAMMVLIDPPECDDQGRCTITFKVDEPKP